jgi:hypothetical protein
MRISFATGGCMGHCPYLAIAIDSSLNYYFEGVEYCDSLHTGFFIGKISQDFWDTLNMKFEQIDYMHLDSAYEHSADDLATEIFIYTKDKRKRIIGQEMSLPENLLKVYGWLFNSYKTMRLSKVIDTKIQNPVPPPPPPITLINQLRINPPKSK